MMMIFRKNFRQLVTQFFFIILLTFFGCKTTQFKSSFSTPSTKTQYTQSIQIIQGESDDKKCTWHCVRINLDAPEISLKIIPSTNNDDIQLTTTTLKRVCQQNNALIAINTTPFAINSNEPKVELVGITKIDEKQISPPVEKYAALCFTKTPWRAHIITTQAESTLENFPYAIGGFFRILENEQMLQFKQIKNSRSAAATSHNGRFLYLFAATPKRTLFPNKNAGLTYEECAEILLNLGCTDALQFDGGHSTGLYDAQSGKYLEKPVLQRKVPAMLLVTIRDSKSSSE